MYRLRAALPNAATGIRGHPKSVSTPRDDSCYNVGRVGVAFHAVQAMSQSIMISVCVRLLPNVDSAPIRRTVVGNHGKLRPRLDTKRFWAVTDMTLKQVEALDGVKDCTLSPSAW